MIEVTIHRMASDLRIREFRVTGHAGFSERGTDIVCAGVSAITVGTVNSVNQLLGIRMSTEMKEGFLHAVVPKLSHNDDGAAIQLLLESMLIMLKTIEQSYGDYIKIREVRM